ncbi:meso-butanediol dehydrogenase / (S,S)-butanediol dehydrogenase / diacetyl reductase (plasmid) [Ensifer sp. WSM1721]|uniref:SDR family NAD(P)-dependent oxidoreductase n=1 Tax=Ensifer sp. WSM1721 TaxID=1041159 RepID=UPI00047B943C|nr:SDR family NAD(P)-dependent oxidoreductase [Ensifer sp. WSM1721]
MANKEVALISGGGSGIGRAVALRLASRGATVGVLDRDRTGAEETADLISQAGGQAKVLIADVSRVTEVDVAVAEFVAAADGLDTLVAAAGVARGGLVHRMSEAAWDQVINVNLKGTFLLARAGIPFLQRRGGGAFVAIGSDAGVVGAIAYGAYCASKHGVIGLVKAMALDYGGQAIRCNVVCPGFVDTPMANGIFAKAPEGTREAFEAAVPMGRFARPEEVANVVAHLTSAEASYTNGNVYLIDGGSSAGHMIGRG